jgi:hypothetical protein
VDAARAAQARRNFDVWPYGNTREEFAIQNCVRFSSGWQDTTVNMVRA